MRIHHFKQCSTHIVAGVLSKSGQADVSDSIPHHTVIRYIFDVYFTFLHRYGLHLIRSIPLDAQDDFRPTGSEQDIFDFFIGFSQNVDSINSYDSITCAQPGHDSRSTFVRFHNGNGVANFLDSCSYTVVLTLGFKTKAFNFRL